MNTQSQTRYTIFTCRFINPLCLIQSSRILINLKHSWLSITCLLLLLLMPYSSSESESEVITIDVHKANHLLRNANYRYLDVRTWEEFQKGHTDTDFHHALNVPCMFHTPQGRVKNNNFLEQVLPLFTKDDHIVVGCEAGIRSVYATTILLDAGFKHVYNMGGGYLAWLENGLPVVPTPKEDL